jgi:hypothetical protein
MYLLRGEILILFSIWRFLSVLHSRKRNKCSALNAYLYHANLIVTDHCLCGYDNANGEHYLLHRFVVMRIITYFIEITPNLHV